MPLSDVICNGCEGKGHYRNACPTANPQLKGKGKGGGGWNPKGGGWAKGGGWNPKGKGKNKGKGKGKGKGSGKGLYELDLMNGQSAQWGGSWDQGWDQGYDQNQGWDQWGTEDMAYLRSLGCFSVAVDKNTDSASLLESWLSDHSIPVPRPPIAISNRYAAIDDDAETMTVPIGDLVKKSTRAKKLKPRKNILMSHGASCSCCPSIAARPYEPTLFPALPGHEGPSAWATLRATQNYENFMLQTYGTDVTGIDIEVIKNTSLGVEGWALYDVGEDLGGGVADIVDNEHHEFYNPSDDDNIDDLFPEDNREKLINTDPSAPLVVGGLAPVVISGHRPGEDRPGENIFDGGIAPVAPLAVGLAPLGSGHWAMEESPPRGAATAKREMFDEVSLRPKPVTLIKSRSGSSRWGGDSVKKFSRPSTSKSSNTTSTASAGSSRPSAALTSAGSSRPSAASTSAGSS